MAPMSGYDALVTALPLVGSAKGASNLTYDSHGILADGLLRGRFQVC